MEDSKFKIREAVVVEGRDDTRAIKRGVECQTIETHGFGISEETFKKIEKAYKTIGIIIFTDPDFAGEKIRKRLLERFPKAKNAYLKRSDAENKGNIGIENANEKDIVEALKKARAIEENQNDVGEDEYTWQDLVKWGLIGEESKEKRQKLGKILGIGYSNGSGLVKKLNGFKIDKEEFEKAVKQL